MSEPGRAVTEPTNQKTDTIYSRTHKYTINKVKKSAKTKENTGKKGEITLSPRSLSTRSFPRQEEDAEQPPEAMNDIFTLQHEFSELNKMVNITALTDVVRYLNPEDFLTYNNFMTTLGFYNIGN